ncbi:hypothetical protein M5W66_18095, partial [Paenibacillus larvae]|uniref:hypothetical protein n=1 Tax=Paenibacillus larvae TaxID=1464 RepID=UPI00227F771D
LVLWSRLLSTPHAWKTFGKKRVELSQADEHTALQEGDIINLDDTRGPSLYQDATISLLAL